MKAKLILISVADVDHAKLVQLEKTCQNMEIPLVEAGMRWVIAKVEACD